MVEVFKTNVTELDHADMLIERIHHAFCGYRANFDLQDCDRILRIKCIEGAIHPAAVIRLLNKYGFWAEVLDDDIHYGSFHLDKSGRLISY